MEPLGNPGRFTVDPVGMELLFERFLSEERGEWPDIDLDLPSGDDRERVIQHVYERYGRLGAGMTANVITYRGRSAAREVGKVLSIAPDRIDRLSKAMHNFEWTDPNDTFEGHIREVGLDPDESNLQLFGDLWRRVQDLPRHLGQHSGGMVICRGRLDEVVPLENASMPDRVVVQWDKDDCADMGIVKVDLLGLGMMAAIQEALTLINTPTPRVDLAHLPPDDSAVYRMLQEADIVGVFQVESRAQMATLPRLRPERFYDIVVEVAIIRPGPIIGQMVHPYLKRRAGREPVTYPHPSLEPILRRTLGVPLFQEQLLRIAMVAAGFTGGEAEELRRAFGFKRSERQMDQIEVKLRAGMEKRGIVGEAADQMGGEKEGGAFQGVRRQEAGEKQKGPLPSMTTVERVIADYQGTGLTVGPHPMTFRRNELAMRGVLRSVDLRRTRDGRRVRVAGAVITRQRPGTAKGFVFLTLEDETGVANIIVRPDIFADQKMTILEQPFLLVEGRLQIQDRVVSVKAERCQGLWAAGPDVDSHDFH